MADRGVASAAVPTLVCGCTAAHKRSAMILLPVLALFAVLAEAEKSCPCPAETAAVLLCGSDGETYSSECDLDCARATRHDVTVLHPGPCLDTARLRKQLLFASPGFSSIEECHHSCAENFRICQRRCMDYRCIRMCSVRYLADCNCACKRYLSSVERSPTQHKWAAVEAASVALQFKNSDHGEEDEAQKVIACYNRNAESGNACWSACDGKADCLEACVRRVLDAFCTCGAAARQSVVFAVLTFSLLLIRASLQH